MILSEAAPPLPSVRIVRFARPEVKNALSLSMLEDARDALTHARDSGAIAVVLTGVGNYFCAGADHVEMRAAPDLRSYGRRLQEAGTLLVDTIRTLPIPVLAALNGPAIGGGAELATACDVVIAHPRAYVCFRHARLGLVPAWGTAARLAQKIGGGRASRLLFFAPEVGTEELVTMGFAQDTSEDPLGHALEWCQGLGRPGAVAGIKSLLRGDGDEVEHFTRVFGGEEHLAALAALAALRSRRS
jgi:enoyl-CoA hydratase